METQAKGLLSEECRDALNQVASYELHVSDAYLSMVSTCPGVAVREVSDLVQIMYLTKPSSFLFWPCLLFDTRGNNNIVAGILLL